MRKRKHHKKSKGKVSQHDKLVVDLKNNLTTRLSDLISKLLNTAQDKLFDMADEATSNEDQNRYFELMNQVRSLKTELAEDYLKQVKKYLVPARDYLANEDDTDDEPGELSLIEPEEMEGMVLVKSIGGRATARYREQLSHLEARLEHLALKSDTIFDKEALSPTNFCQAFDDTIKDHFDNANKKTLFTMFEAEVANKLESLYDSINNRLIDADILPQIKLNMHAQKPRRRQGDRKPSAEENAQQTEQSPEQLGDQGGYPEGACGSAMPQQGGATGGGAGMSGAIPNGGAPAGPGSASGAPGGGFSNAMPGADNRAAGGAPAGSAGGVYAPGGYAMTAQPGGTYHHPQTPGGIPPSADQPAAGQAGTIPGGANQPGMPATGSAPTGNTAMPAAPGATAGNPEPSGAAGAEFQHYTAGIPASQVGQALGNFLGTPVNQQTLHGDEAGNAPLFPASTSQHFGHQEIIHALSGLQAQPQFVQPQETRFDAEAIKQAVVAELSKSSGGVVTKRINQIAEKTIDFIELIFDAIIDDEDISDTIKTLLLRLQIPIIKASMSDQEFFIYDDHPARLLLDKIAEVGVGVTDHTDDMFIQLDKIVSDILAEYDLTTETFQKALDDLNTIIEQQEEAARKKEEEAQQQTLRSHARNTVLKALRVVTTGKILPEAVHPLILKRWPTLMFNHYLKYGKENDEWVTLVETLRDIIESIQPIRTAEDLALLRAEKDELIEATRDYLSDSIKSEKDIESVVGGLIDTYEAHIREASYTEEELEQAEETIAEMDDDTDDDLAEKLLGNEPRPELPANVMPGMWFHLYMGDDQLARRCKLSVIVLEDSNLMFVNHKGELVVEKSFDDINAEMASGKTKVIMGHSAFDHALKTVVTNLGHPG